MTDSVPGIDYRFENPHLLRQALTHKSHGPVHYERLEFLGDSILNMVVSTRVFELHPQAPEGDLSRMRARIVRGRTLSEIASGIGLGRQLNLGPGEKRSGGFRRSSILADALEAVLGAIYIDGGYEACRAVILSLCDPLIENLPSADNLKDAKTRLQEWLQGRGRPLPEYTLVREEGADHAKSFHVECRLRDGDEVVGANGASRRKAEQVAAGKLLARLSGQFTEGRHD
ncbi:ribonuclease III [Elongatibacter sediminis]|uniref:Ribonuclease 3 n=1 Tax=Elongatibacter sediminis TaxID=3119006 RepID=A0AAW9REX1_9GAMM